MAVCLPLECVYHSPQLSQRAFHFKRYSPVQVDFIASFITPKSVIIQVTRGILVIQKTTPKVMMRHNRILVFFMVSALKTGSLTFMPSISHAADADAQQMADELNARGLLLGSNGSYDLERAPTRLEASVMLLRLLGKEQAAKTANASHPFIHRCSRLGKSICWIHVQERHDKRHRQQFVRNNANIRPPAICNIFVTGSGVQRQGR